MTVKTDQYYKTPAYYHREYENDLPKKDDVENKVFGQCIRVTQVALPFLCLYQPLGQPLTIILGATRVISSLAQLIENIKSNDSVAIGRTLLEVAIATTALACSIFAHPLGMLVTTAHDMVINVVQLVQAIEDKDYKKAAEIGLHLANNALYLGCFFAGSLEWSIASIGLQIFLGLYHSCDEFNKGNYLEGCGHLLMAGIRGNQLHNQIQFLQYQRKIEKIISSLKNESSNTDKLIKKRIVITDDKIDVASNDKDVKSITNRTSDQFQANIADQTDSNEIAALIVKYSRIDGMPSIFHAAEANDIDAVKKMLSFGGNPDYALYGAIRGKHMSLLEYLVDIYKVSFKDTDWITYWNSSQWWEGFDYLISKGGKIPPLDQYLSCSYSINLLEGLLNRGAKFSPDFNASGIYQNTIFSVNFDSSLRTKIFETLNKDCNPPINQTFSLFDRFYSTQQYTPLSFAIQNNDIATAKALLNLGADPNLKVNYRSPLKMAKLKNNQDMMSLLIRYGAKVEDV